MNCVTLTDRGLVRIAGEDARTLLQDVISCDVETLPDATARVGALLTPQGKILFEFLISRVGKDGFLFDMDRDQVRGFVQRMTMYRLRAKADIEEVEGLPVNACWDCPHDPALTADERFPEGLSAYRSYGAIPAASKSMDDYTRLRIDAGVAEGGRDYGLSEAFPHDVLMDLNNGVSMKKGCFVGQEVVSRMQHRGTARRRIVQVAAEQSLPPCGASLTADGRVLGQLGTVLGNNGLALVRTDRVGKAIDEDTAIFAGDVVVRLTLPNWTGLSFPTAAKESGI
jgi:hypothetical protein